MKCGRVQLWDRRSLRRDLTHTGNSRDRPRRYCQQRMVNPNHEEDPRWTEGILERFWCDNEEESSSPRVRPNSNSNEAEGPDDLVLTVLNLKFTGDHLKSKYPRSCFKYKMPSTESNQTPHRMFVKQLVEFDSDADSGDEGSSQEDCKFDDYVKDILNGIDPSRPSTSVSAIFYQNPIVQHASQETLHRETQNSQTKESSSKNTKAIEFVKETNYEDNEKTTVKYHSSGKRRSLTISRTQSPETVQVIRVDVVCNYSGRSSVDSTYGVNRNVKPEKVTILPDKDKPTQGYHDVKHRAGLSSRYILTNTVKQLDENVRGGEKVTLLCKTFKLSTRAKKTNDKDEYGNNNRATEQTQERNVRRKQKKNTQ